MASDFSYEVVEGLGVLAPKEGAKWSTHLNRISWNGNAPKLDIRSWNEDMSRMGKGVSLTEDEARDLYDLLGTYFNGGTAEEEEALTAEEMLAELAEQHANGEI